MSEQDSTGDPGETVAAKVKALRTSLPPKEGRRSRLGHLSIEDFAEALGTTKQRVIDWERGTAYPDTINRGRLASLSEGRYRPDDFARPGGPDDRLKEAMKDAVRDVLETEQFPRLERLGDALARLEEAIQRLGQTKPQRRRRAQ